MLRQFSLPSRLLALYSPAIRDAIIASIAVLAVSAITGYVVYTSAADGLKKEVQASLLSITKSAAGFMDGDSHKMITQPEDKGSDLYKQIQAPLLTLLRANPNIAFIYTVIPKDDKIFFIMDSKILKEGEEDDTSGVMEEYTDATDTMKQALAEQKALVEEESYTDDWGTFLSAYVPIYDSSNQYIGIVGADIRLTDYLAHMAKIRNALVIGMGVAFVASLIIGVCVWYARNANIQSEARNKAQQLQLEAMEKARVEQQERDKILAEKQKKDAMNAMAKTFESSVKEVVTQVAASSEIIQHGLHGITSIAEDTKDRSAAMTSASTEASQMSSQVAAAAEELSASVQEISSQTQKSREISMEAATTAEDAQHIIESLAGKASKVGEIINVITSIAGQINLLALNATIESARAGEAGRGFAVVASEVKNLAAQVGNATEAISTQINEMQAATAQSVDAVMKIISIISQVSERALSVAAAVEEQSVVTNEIASNIARASSGVQQISSEIRTVQDGAERVSYTTKDVAESAQTLNSQSNVLKQKVDEFMHIISNA